MTVRRFPAPWTFVDYHDACFIVMDASGLAVTYVYYEEEAGRRKVANLMTKDEARRIAAAGLVTQAHRIQNRAVEPADVWQVDEVAPGEAPQPLTLITRR
jgi:hypothetical protein